MEPFVLPEVLAKVLEAAGASRDRVTAIAREEAAKHPNFKAWEEAVEARLRAELDPSLNATVLTGLVMGGLEELRTGHPGHNPHSFGGG